jgi:peptidoglycan-associated lipoprotein
MRHLILIPIFAVFGCAHRQETKTAAVSPPPASPAPATAPAVPAATGCGSDLDCDAQQLCLRSRCVDISADLAECSGVRVHFAFNSAELDAAEKPAVERSARCLKADHALRVTIAGNADERGTEEYNIALGERRAATVKGYLESLGASEAQLETVSYGKENPLCTQHDEDCWAKNRRAEMKGTKTAEATRPKRPKR